MTDEVISHVPSDSSARDVPGDSSAPTAVPAARAADAAALRPGAGPSPDVPAASARAATRSGGPAPSYITSLLGRPPASPGTAVSPPIGQLRVAIQHGSLKFIKTPLMVGHYRSDSLTGAERVVNDLIGKTMSVALHAGSYPDEPGSHRVFVNTKANPDNPLSMPRPHAVIVVGLGDEGSLRAAGLAQTVRHGVIGWAQRLLETRSRETGLPDTGLPDTGLRQKGQREAGQRETFELASTLIGSGGAGVSAGSSARAIVQGVLDANDRLAKCGWPTVGSLTLIEVYLDRAGEAWRELEVTPAVPFQLERVVKEGVGGLLRPLEQDYRGADYDLVTATTRGDGPDAGNIYYTLDTRRARTEVRAQATQVNLVRKLVQSSATHALRDAGADTGRTLFRLLVPVDLRPFLMGEGSVVLQLDSTTAAIPWELLRTDDDAEKPWAIRSRLLRKFETTKYRNRVADAGSGDRFLVIGNPKLTGTKYRPLAGAASEAKKVATLLEQRFPNYVHALQDGADAIQIMNAVLTGRYRVVHIAAHGELGAGKGVVLSDDIFLSAKEIGSMETVPELVFINCCHLAAADATPVSSPPEFDAAMFAASVAEALIDIGVRCVVAAGWAVGDEAAAEFACALYAELTQGRTFQEAVQAARKAARNAKQGDNTWAAYQCYGDPGWRLLSDAPGQPASTKGPAFPTPLSLRLYLETLVAQVKFDGRNKDSARDDIAKLDHSAWGHRGDVAEAFGDAYAAVSSTGEAIDWYRRAAKATDRSSSVRAMEQLANLVARQAMDNVRAPKAPGAAPDLVAARKALEEALTLIGELLGLARTSERLSLRGSAFKRRAMLERIAGDEQAEATAIASMRDAYREAKEAATEPSERLYAAQNQLAAELVLAAAQPPPFELPDVASLLEAAAILAKGDPNFWSVVAVTELQIYEAYASGSLPAKLDGLFRDFEDLRGRVSAAWQWASVRDTADFVFARPVVRSRYPAEVDRLLGLLAKFAGQ